MIVRQKGSWIQADNSDNAAAVATAAASGSNRHFITSVSGGYDTSGVSGTLTLTDGTITAVWPVHDAFAIVFPSPVEMTPGDAVTLTLTASGTGGQLGYVALTGYTL